MQNITRVLEKTAASLIGVLMFLLVMITFVDVVGRQMGYPLGFAFEFTQLTVGVVFYCVLPLVTLKGEHITVDLIAVDPDSRKSRAVASLVNLLCAGAIAMTSIQLWHQGGTLEQFNTVTMFIRWPIAPFVYFMSCMAMATALVCVALALTDANRSLRRGKE